MSPVPPESNGVRRVIVVGGGISGLAAAHRVGELAPRCEVVLLEAAGRLGGVLQTVRRDEFLLERSADNFITNPPWGVELCRRVGLADELLPTTETLRRAYIVKDGRLCEVPPGFLLMVPKQLGAIVRTPLLSWPGKLRLAREYFVPPRRGMEDESVASFATRRLGREAFERLVQPLVGGIYTADPTKLSMAAALPRFVEMERQHGGLIRAARADAASPKSLGDQESGARYGMFVAPRDGMSSLVRAVAARLPAGAVRLNAPVKRIARAADTWQVALADGEVLTSDGLILATPAPQAARLLTDLDPRLATELAAIEHAGSSVVTVAYRRDQIAQPLRGFGFVVPSVEKRRILAGSFSSLKFPGRAPDDHVLIRVFVGGALQPELAELPDEELIALVQAELADLLGVAGAPRFAQVARWLNTMPQYHLGHVERVARIEALAQAHPHFALAGNAYHGVGVPQCIHSGETAAGVVVGG